MNELHPVGTEFGGNWFNQAFFFLALLFLFFVLSIHYKQIVIVLFSALLQIEFSSFHFQYITSSSHYINKMHHFFKEIFIFFHFEILYSALFLLFFPNSSLPFLLFSLHSFLHYIFSDSIFFILGVAI